jgi:DNA-binding PadR family transcriptional regulator
LGAPKNEETSSLPKDFTRKEIETRLIRSFLDLAVLFALRKNGGLSGYDVMALVQNKFDKSISPGTIYSVLYSIERKGLVKGESDGRKTNYKLTDKGREVTESMLGYRKEMIEFMKKIMNLDDSE